MGIGRTDLKAYVRRHVTMGGGVQGHHTLGANGGFYDKREKVAITKQANE